MTERIVTNTSPLLAFAKMRAFAVIGKLPFDFICPTEVETEILEQIRNWFTATKYDERGTHFVAHVTMRIKC